MQVKNLVQKLFSASILVVAIGTLLPWGVAVSTGVRGTTRGLTTVGGFAVLSLSIILGVYTLRNSVSEIIGSAVASIAIFVSLFYIVNPVFPETSGNMFVGQVYPGIGVYLSLFGGVIALASVCIIKFSSTKTGETRPI
ncbi:hypothetical protein [Natrinema pallidum]|uniref:hypothetical protein n=1 Tax=Natrinema pallidum TaxID=69527 RepID=UPI00126962DC|nr:hypothetical protein [Natrinema pallidum]